MLAPIFSSQYQIFIHDDDIVKYFVKKEYTVNHGCIWKPQVSYENYLREDDEVKNYMLYQNLVRLKQNRK